MNKDLTKDYLGKLAKDFSKCPKNKLAMNAVVKSGPRAATTNWDVVKTPNRVFSDYIKTPAITNQKGSGRCWLFSALNTFRMKAIKKMNIDEFEFSQAYPMFWDKLEKANYFLESILETMEEETDGRLIQHLLGDPLGDGGQWDMMVNLVQKYGLVPKTVYPESYSSSSTGSMNGILTSKLKEFACTLREAYKKGEKIAALRAKKGEMIQQFYNILTIHMGTPPTEFMWQWRDKKGKFHRKGVMTPQQFYKEFVGINLDDYVCLINAPTKDKPYEKMYTVKFLGNVVGGHPVRYLNVDIDTIKEAAIKTIKGKEVVWFGCDVGKQLDGNLGILDLNMYDEDLLGGAGCKLNKAQRLDYNESRMNHAMVLTAVDIDSKGKPVRWLIENSWGDKNEGKGFLTMTDEWFSEYTYEVAVNKKYLSEKLKKVLKTKLIELKPWDPMGSLAK